MPHNVEDVNRVLHLGHLNHLHWEHFLESRDEALEIVPVRLLINRHQLYLGFFLLGYLIISLAFRKVLTEFEHGDVLKNRALKKIALNSKVFLLLLLSGFVVSLIQLLKDSLGGSEASGDFFVLVLHKILEAAKAGVGVAVGA